MEGVTSRGKLGQFAAEPPDDLAVRQHRASPKTSRQLSHAGPRFAGIVAVKCARYPGIISWNNPVSRLFRPAREQLSIICPLEVTCRQSNLTARLILDYSNGRIIPASTASLGGTAMAADVRDMTPARTWLRSSLCTPGKNCVEISRTSTDVVIRDSKSKAVLSALGGVPWAAFLAHCQAMR